MLAHFFAPIHPDAWRFLIPGSVLSFLGYRWDMPLVGLVFAVLTLWIAYFFRNPVRCVPQNKGLVVAPADGRVSHIMHTTPPGELGLDTTEKWVRVSIFLNIFNVHVNRVPLAGKLKNVVYHKGKFLNASLDKASEHNERNTLVVESDNGITYACTQIAGLIARRIRCDVHKGAHVITGQYFGLIRFGSRLDVYFPATYAPRVCVGQLTVAGETILFDTNGEQTSIFGTEI